MKCKSRERTCNRCQHWSWKCEVKRPLDSITCEGCRKNRREVWSSIYHSAGVLRSVKCVLFHDTCERCAAWGQACSLLPGSSDHAFAGRQTPSSDGSCTDGVSERAVPLVAHAGRFSPRVTKEVDMDGEGPVSRSRCYLQSTQMDELLSVSVSLVFESVYQRTKLSMHSRSLVSVLRNLYTWDP